MAKFVSAEEHAIKGTEPRPRQATVIPLALLGGRPKCPRTLSKAARRVWLSAVKLLENRGTLDPGAGDTLELYATTKARWLECMADLDKNGLRIQVQKSTSTGLLYMTTIENPMLRIAQDCEAALQQMTKTLGIAPDARDKVKKVKPAARASAEPLWMQKARAKLKQDDHGQ